MINRNAAILRATLFLAVILVIISTPTVAQTGLFTYQGRLIDSGAAASGTYQMEFRLYDALTVGTQQGPTVTNNSVTVTNGSFRVDLDFSPATPFATGADRWIEIAVRKAADPPGFTTLAPRQQVTSNPYATRSASANSSDSMSAACVLCITNAHISGIDGGKVTGTVANATNAASAATAANNVLKSGDTMTGALTLPANGLIVGTNQLVAANGSVGIGTTPAASAQLDVSSTTKGFLPPRMTSVQRDAITPAEGLIIYNTTSKKPNFYNGTYWQNFDGSFAYAIGDNYQGGKIAYILQSGDPGYNPNVPHGLIAAASDLAQGQWGCSGTVIPGADGTALGTGNQNTIDIMAGCTTAGIAARICGDLVLNGFSDWYLPSKDELSKLYINRVAIGSFTTDEYWTSSEFDSNIAWLQSFFTGTPSASSSKVNSNSVRAVRAF